MWRSLAHLFVPHCCAVCRRVLVEGESLVCTACRWNMPLTNTCADPENPIRQRLNLIHTIEPLTALETSDYIKHRFSVAGAGA